LPDPIQSVAAIQAIEAVPNILNVVCRVTGMGFAAVARVTEDRWIACEVDDRIDFGLKPGGELKLETTICNEIREAKQRVVINHVAEDRLYRDHHTPAMYGFQSYISVPIILPDGRFFGTLCAIDPAPHVLDKPETLQMFDLFAQMIASQLDAQEKLESAQQSLADEQRTAQLREQFIAVLGHDLRNPLASIEAAIRMLLKTKLEDRATVLVGLARESVWRASGLIDNVLDFARGRLGGGLQLEMKAVDLAPMLNHVVEELRAAHPARTIDVAITLTREVGCDPSRIGQLVSNLLANALTHGAPGEPIRLLAREIGGEIEIAVANAGAAIAPATMQRLFQPFERGVDAPSQQGLGLGLFIASEIAKAHGGEIVVASTADETSFALRMPG
jgi:signal transduction histidine kinase